MVQTTPNPRFDLANDLLSYVSVVAWLREGHIRLQIRAYGWDWGVRCSLQAAELAGQYFLHAEVRIMSRAIDLLHFSA